MSTRTLRLTSRLSAVTTALVLGGTMLTVTAAPASAAEARNGKCEEGEFCYYYNSNNKGSISDFNNSVANYGDKQPSCYDFKGPGTGKGKCVKNNAASIWNRTGKTVRVHYNSNNRGAHQDFNKDAKANLNRSLKNQNASHSLLDLGCKTDATHSKPPSTILVYMRSQKRVKRVDFKDYVKNVLPNEWIPSWPDESLRAGAVAVKSYGWHWALHSTRRTSWGACFDVYDDVWSQVYRPGSAKRSTSAAVDATWSARMTRGGKIFQAQYCQRPTACPDWRDGNWMSQEGSRDKARAGWNHSQILKHYYWNIALRP
ncbi:SpoIID/LytB domain protein [Actinomadura pelletieri DSM 43383]|uniref:SpoIID/LytB domain protein n=1 Tax=Actinomadura pelletieri DSM 43383 TaxID=1120940 RepID=A0A495QTG6_9ACTN|nr:SpoIID/LytB domain-containing protein [Actinomadura pelletieri]RKS76717.1 SpoIID/LytB domain protein [Actinomadura pelletieri DSM 43383]